MTGLTTPQTVAAFLTPTALFLLFLVLHAVIHARHVDGYTHPSASGIPNRSRPLPLRRVRRRRQPGALPALGDVGPGAAHELHRRPGGARDGAGARALHEHLDLGLLRLLTLFFVVRERIDEGRRAGKYGELWTQYRGKARYRLLPGVY